MPTTDYFNANSFKPMQPQGQFAGAGAGFDYQQDRQRYDQMVQLQKLLTGLEAAKRQEEFTQGFGQRQAERGSKTAEFDLKRMIDTQAQQTSGYGGAIVGGRMGEANTKEAAGRKAMGTLQTDITAGNAKNRTATLEDEARRLEYLTAGGDNLAGNMEYQKFYNNIPDDLKGHFPKQYDKSVPETLRKIHNVLTQSPAHRRQVDEIGQKGAWDIKKQETANAGAVNVANARSGARNLDFDQALKRAATPAHIMSIASQIDADTTIDERQRDTLKARAKAAFDKMVAFEAAKADKQPGIADLRDPGAPGNRVNERLNPGGGQQQQQYRIGQIYPGRTGKYRYKGGPPASPSSWEKVQ